MFDYNIKNEGKRKDYISWDDYFMSVALLSAKRSKDPCTQVGACIVNSYKQIIGIGYNGLPINCSDDVFSWNKFGNFIDTKYAYVCHAELNAIINSIGNILEDCSLYTVLFPCNECAKVIIQSRIKRVVFLLDKYKETNTIIASKRMFNEANINYQQLVPNQKYLCIKML